MKNLFKIIFLLNFISMNAQPINFPDANFKYKLVNANTTNQTANETIIDINNNGEIEQSEALLVTYLFLYASNISDLTGIEYFTNITGLSVAFNSLTNLNILALTKLTSFSCAYNNLSTLNVNGLTEFKEINFMHNNLISFDFSGLPNLKEVFCNNNYLTTLDFSNNQQFEELVCDNNNLTSINIKNGAMQLIGSASSWQNCWNMGNSNLTQICVDANEVAPLQAFMSTCSGTQPTINSSCPLANFGFSKNSFSIYPNPTKSILNISSDFNIKSLELLDIQNRILISQTTNQMSISLDISGYEIGVYYIKINTENGIQIERVIKE